MSADNWCQCPKCGKDFREDYEIGIVDDVFEVNYSGSCEGTRENPGCGFTYSFKKSDVVFRLSQ